MDAEEKMKRYKRCAVLLLVAALAVTGCGRNRQSNQRQQQAMENSQKEAALTATAVVEYIDPEKQCMELRDIVTGEEQSFSYSSGTKIFSKNNVALVMEQLSCGEIVDVSYGGAEKLLTEIRVSKDAWEYSSILAENVDRDENQIRVTGRTYSYDSQLSVFSRDQKLMLLDLNDSDEVTIKGIGTKAYSIRITRGHGYLRLGGQDAFLGGTIEVDRKVFQQVQQNMLLTLGVGEHTVALRNGDLEAVEKITVNQDQETFLDLSTYEPEEVTEGKVKITVTPSDALLYINGEQKQANQILRLPYGNYNVAVLAEGYQSYTGILHVQKSSSDYEAIDISLAKSSGASVETSKAPSATQNANATEMAGSPAPTVTGDATPVATATATPAPDSIHTITVKTPEGASVYLDGEYQGSAPVSFKKVAGEHTITLSQVGYATKSYTVTVNDGTEDVTYSFASLVKE